MEVLPTFPFENFHIFLNELSLDPDIWLNVEKLVEVIQLELLLRVHPKLTMENIEFFHWSDGYTHITISIHVEDDNQVIQVIELDIGD